MTFANEPASAPFGPLDRAREIVEGLGDGFLSVDADWRLTDCNRAAERFLSRARADLLGHKIWIVTGLPKDSSFAALGRRVAASRAPEGAELAYRQDGRRRVLAVQAFPLGGGIAAVWRDITLGRTAQRRLAQSEALYRELAHGAPAPAWVSRPDGQLEFINQAMVETLGRPREALLGEGWLDAVDPADLQRLPVARLAARANCSEFSYEGRFRRSDGALRIIQLYGRPRFDGKGDFRGLVGMATDITEVRASERRQRLLINELNHRVKNTLATVQFLVGQTLRDEQTPKAVQELVTERLLALSAAHEVLNRSNWIGADLDEVARQAVRPFDISGRITLAGPPVRVSPNAAIALSLAFYELATNAAKYGALATPSGRVELTWTLVGDAAALAWVESGGPPVKAPEQSGFGSRMLGKMLTGALGHPAELIYAPPGLICRIRVNCEGAGGSESPDAFDPADEP